MVVLDRWLTGVHPTQESNLSLGCDPQLCLEQELVDGAADVAVAAPGLTDVLPHPLDTDPACHLLMDPGDCIR